MVIPAGTLHTWGHGHHNIEELNSEMQIKIIYYLINNSFVTNLLNGCRNFLFKIRGNSAQLTLKHFIRCIHVLF